MSLLDFNAEHELKRSAMKIKNAQSFDDWHNWVNSLSNYEKGLPDPEPLIYYTVKTRFDIKI